MAEGWQGKGQAGNADSCVQNEYNRILYLFIVKTLCALEISVYNSTHCSRLEMW